MKKRGSEERKPTLSRLQRPGSDGESGSHPDECFGGNRAATNRRLRDQAARATSAAEKAFCADQVRQLKAYQAELKDYTPELPTITFDKSYLLRDPAYDLHVEFHGHAHTSGDVVVYCPQARAVATGDVIHGFLPNSADGFPRLWQVAIDSIGGDDFNTILPGHAALQRPYADGQPAQLY